MHIGSLENYSVRLYKNLQDSLALWKQNVNVNEREWWLNTHVQYCISHIYSLRTPNQCVQGISVFYIDL